MLIFPDQIANAATQAGMKVPPDPEAFNPNEFPHFHVYCNVQLCRKITWGNHWRNAEIIAAIPEQQLRTLTLEQLERLGFDP